MASIQPSHGIGFSPVGELRLAPSKLPGSQTCYAQEAELTRTLSKTFIPEFSGHHPALRDLELIQASIAGRAAIRHRPWESQANGQLPLLAPEAAPRGQRLLPSRLERHPLRRSGASRSLKACAASTQNCAWGDEHDHVAEQRYTDSDVAEHLSHYTAEASLLPDDRGVIGDERDILADDDGVVPEASQLDLGAPEFSSPLQVALHAPPLPDPIPENKEPSRSDISSPSSRLKQIPKPEREVHKKSDGKFHCPLDDCKEDIRAFSRKCEWNKHMDKHERPYRCPAEGCENLPGFTYSGGLLRHEREVHGKHGGPKNTVNCPHPNCKRHTGKGFSRQENLNEHLRRVHTNMDTSASPVEIVASPEDDESEKSGSKRKRRLSSQGIDELSDLRDEIKRVREENEKLKSEMDQQSQHSLAMMAQIAELQDALRHSLNPHGLGAPTAQMI
ncbi:hypothetical protein TrVFT333_002697 [Trichoderma virens FT-333]|nr:hypothetical protein TrVFT333_002697 [Trichoderma virens FT-333]